MHGVDLGATNDMQQHKISNDIYSLMQTNDDNDDQNDEYSILIYFCWFIHLFAVRRSMTRNQSFLFFFSLSRSVCCIEAWLYPSLWHLSPSPRKWLFVALPKGCLSQCGNEKPHHPLHSIPFRLTYSHFSTAVHVNVQHQLLNASSHCRTARVKHYNLIWWNGCLHLNSHLVFYVPSRLSLSLFLVCATAPRWCMEFDFMTNKLLRKNDDDFFY